MFINNNKKFLITTTLFSLLLTNYNFATAADADNANTEVNATITSTTTNAKTNENNAVENNANDASNSTRNTINFLGLTDPTKPPNASDSAQYDADGNMVANSGHPVLQGVLFQGKGRKVAVINAKSYHPGDSINIGGENLKLSRINEDNVVLSGGSAGQITLSLTPAVNKNFVSSKKNKKNKNKK